jgi:hypothetical protein
MVLRDMQQLLGSIYDAPLQHDVHDFLVTDRSQLPQGGSGADEQLFVANDADGVYLSLYVDGEVLQRLAAADPAQQLHSGNVADYLTALEGVSHFQYLSFHVTQDRAVTALELELQGEIDKYLGCLWLLREQAPGRFPRELRAQLFSSLFRIDARLDAATQSMYREASALASKYCATLERSASRAHPHWPPEFVSVLRRFYRWPMARKLHHIRHLPTRLN